MSAKRSISQHNRSTRRASSTAQHSKFHPAQGRRDVSSASWRASHPGEGAHSVQHSTRQPRGHDNVPSAVSRDSAVTLSQPDANLDVEDEEQDGVVLAINYTDKQSIGCAYYVHRTQTLFLMDDVTSGNPGLAETCKLASTLIV